VVFEDLHWADSESVALFERIAELPGPGLLIGTYRPDEITRRHPLADLLTRLERRYTVTNVRLERLKPRRHVDVPEVRDRAPAGLRTALSLHNRTGGNPFFLEEPAQVQRRPRPRHPVRPAAAVEPSPRRCAARSTTSTTTRSHRRGGRGARPQGAVRPARRRHRLRRERPASTACATWCAAA